MDLFCISTLSSREPQLDAITGNFFSQPVGVELLTQTDNGVNQASYNFIIAAFLYIKIGKIWKLELK